MSGNDRGAVTRSTDRRSVDTDYGSRSGGSRRFRLVQRRLFVVIVIIIGHGGSRTPPSNGGASRANLAADKSAAGPPQEDASNRKKRTKGKGGQEDTCFLSPPFLLFPCSPVYLLTAALFPLSSFSTSEPAPSQLSITNRPFSITIVSEMILSSIFV